MVIKLKHEYGVWIDDQKAIVDKFILDYSKKFKSTHNTNRTLPNLGLAKLISDTENSELIRLPDMEEIKQALFSIESNKTSGPDGFGAGKILKEINHTFIMLTPKASSPSQTSQFRPISLCSTVSKLYPRF